MRAAVTAVTARQVREFNGLLASQPATASLALSSDEAAGGLDAVLVQLPAAPAAPASSPAFSAAGGAYMGVLGKLLRWPAAQVRASG